MPSCSSVPPLVAPGKLALAHHHAGDRRQVSLRQKPVGAKPLLVGLMFFQWKACPWVALQVGPDAPINMAVQSRAGAEYMLELVR